jgi:hypothetical protein
MAFWLFNCVPSGPAASRVVERVDELLEAGVWDVADDEPHRNSLAAGDLVLVYLGAPDRVFVARAELASSVQPWAPDEMGPAALGAGRSGVRLVQLDRWDPPVPMDAVLSRIDPVNQAKADFDKGVVGITRHEFEAALAAASSR